MTASKKGKQEKEYMKPNFFSCLLLYFGCMSENGSVGINMHYFFGKV